MVCDCGSSWSYSFALVFFFFFVVFWVVLLLLFFLFLFFCCCFFFLGGGGGGRVYLSSHITSTLCVKEQLRGLASTKIPYAGSIYLSDE